MKIFILIFSLLISSASIAEQRLITIDYQTNRTPIDLSLFLETMGRVTAFWYSQCNVIFSINSIDNVLNSTYSNRRILLSWNEIPNQKLGSTNSERTIKGEIFNVVLSNRLKQREIEKVLAHELGHVLGLKHTDDRSSLMHPELLGNKLSFDELNTCRY